MNQLISILMPVKDAFLYLDDCLKSILLQSYSNWELIAINDNSSDGSFQLLNSYSKKDSRIKVVNNRGKGIIDALKTGYKEVNGDYITRMDADDTMPICKLEELISLLQQYGENHVATGLVQYFSNKPLGNGYLKYEKWINGLGNDNTHFSAIYKECCIPSPCWMMGKYDFEKCGGFNSDIYPEDYDLVFRMYQNNMKVISSNKILHHWRDSEKRASRVDNNYKDNRFLELKSHYYIEIDYNKSKPLFLWGAGKKGKKIAKILSEKNIEFRWICNSNSKIGHIIYGVSLENCEIADLNNSHVIIAVANEIEQLQIQKIISGYKEVKCFYFC